MAPPVEAGEEAAEEADDDAMEDEMLVADDTMEVAMDEAEEVVPPPAAPVVPDAVVVTAPVERPLVEADAFKHESLAPAWMIRGELYAMLPVVSLRLMVMLLPAARLTVQVYGLAVTPVAMNSIAGAEG